MIAKVNTLTKEITFTSGPYPSATGDDTVQRLNFEMDRYTGNGTDLYGSDIYVYYTNGRGVTYAHPFPKRTLSSDGLYIKFTWDFAREVAEYTSPTQFSVCAKIANGDIITNEWNSEIATLPIIKSIGHRDISYAPTTYETFEKLFNEMRIEANKARDYSRRSELYAKGSMDGIDVSEGEEGYQDNAKYYKEYTEAIAPTAMTNSEIFNIMEG